MPIPKNFPPSPYAEMLPSVRWTPDNADNQLYTNLMPPLVEKLRHKVKEWRDNNYDGASDTSRALLQWWFKTEHASDAAEPFRYYFAQREAVETVIYLYDVAKAKDKSDLLRYDSSGAIAESLFPEEWLRLVIKMATGSGKTKVISLLMAWSYFHKMYEDDSKLARNFLLIAPNIIVLDRLKTDFEGLRIFSEDPVLPDNGYEGENWRDDFQLRVRLQDDISAVRETGNLFLTNIHRIYSGRDRIPGVDDDNTMNYFLGSGKAAQKVTLADVVRDIGELTIFNDEAHHIHDERLAWFKSIEDIDNGMKRRGAALSLQIDVTATPKHNNGGIFVQTISDYPLVEAIFQNVVKHPVIPDKASCEKLKERPSVKYEEKYQDHIDLGIIEWKKVYDEYQKVGKKAVLFVMTDDTRNCDDVAAYLKKQPDLGEDDAVLTIHTKSNGELFEPSSSKKEKELQKLRKAANEIDNHNNPYKAIVSVLMLKEGWDVKNVTTIVGLRPYQSKSNILPEQTLGRGLRRMFARDDAAEEKVSVIGTDAFMKFVKAIQDEGVELEESAMGAATKPLTGGIVIEVDKDNPKKDIAALDMAIPVLKPRMYRDYEQLSKLDVSKLNHQKLTVHQFAEEDQRKIVFYDIVSGEKSHETIMDGDYVPTYHNILAHYARVIMKELHLFSGYNVLFGKLKEFAADYLFDEKVDLEDLNIVRNLSDISAHRTITETFIKAINALILVDTGPAPIVGRILLSATRPFIAKQQNYLLPQNSVFNKIIGDSSLELDFAGFLESCSDIISFAKNYIKVGFQIDYVNTSGGISQYRPDFLVQASLREAYIIETKGREDIEDLRKLNRLRQWCEDVNAAQSDVVFAALFVRQEDFEKYRPQNFAEAIRLFRLK